MTFLRRAGVGRGDRLLTVLGDGPDVLGLGLAAVLEGVVQVPLHPAATRAEVVEIAADARPVAVVADAERVATVAGFALSQPVLSLDDLAGLPPTAPADDWPTTRPLHYTSGTTGRRKGVWYGLRDTAWGRRLIDREHDDFEGRHGDLHLVVAPLHHSAPFRFALVAALRGAKVAVLGDFDARAWLEALRRLRPSSLFCVPTQLGRLLALPDLRPADLASLRLLAHAGAPCPTPVKERLLALCPEGSVWEFYGATEGQFTICPPAEWAAAPGTVGVARPGTALQVRDDAGAPVADGVTGTVWAAVDADQRWEYWEAPHKTRHAWDGDAFTVGDLGHRVNGRLFLDGRRGDLVVSGGVNVYPAEVERWLAQHPAVAEAVVFGVPDADWGQCVVAAVVPREGATVNGERVRDWLRERLSPPQVPKAVMVVDALPHTASGKVRRTGLADAFGLA